MIVWLTSKRPCACKRLAFIEVDGVVVCEECIRKEAPLQPENQSLQIALSDIGGSIAQQPKKRHSRKRIADLTPPRKRLYYAGGMWTTRED